MLFLSCCCSLTTAQQLPLFTQYRDYHALINPATINSDYILNQYNAAFGTSARLQWLGVENSPQTYVCRGEYFFKNNNRYFRPIVGGHIISDQTGPTGSRGVYARLAALGTHDARKNGILAGLYAGAAQFRLNTTALSLRDPTSLPPQRFQEWYPDIGLGVFVYTALSGHQRGGDDIIYGGLSLPQVLPHSLLLQTERQVYALKRVPHAFATMGYYKFLPYLAKGSFIESSLWVKYAPNVPIQTDFNLRLQVGKMGWGGIGFSTAQMLHTEIGFMVGDNIGWRSSNFKIGYGYDQGFNPTLVHFGASHEINITFLIDHKP